ncbi:MAG: hypothetical protein GKS07_05960 [Nitrosopumilus sp.]|nr:MAG: hypothetical protein GKS07_05960 [Nitrosopumilus sp.]
MIHKSGLQAEAELKNKWVRLIQQEGIIKRIDLMQRLKITIRKYNYLSGFIQEEYEDSLEYNRSNKRWMWIAKEEIESAVEDVQQEDKEADLEHEK